MTDTAASSSIPGSSAGLSANASYSYSYSYTFTPSSYAIPILHSAAHPSSTVLGVFLSSPSSSSSSSSSPSATAAKDMDLVIESAIPLIHHYTAYTPMTETALSLVHEYASSTKRNIVGLYIAHASGETTLGRVGERVLGALREKYQGAFVLVIDNDRLASGQSAYIPYLALPGTSSTSQPKPLPNTSEGVPKPFVLPSPTWPEATLSLIREKKVHRSLKDFDDHLEDSSYDFLENPDVHEAIRTHFT